MKKFPRPSLRSLLYLDAPAAAEAIASTEADALIVDLAPKATGGEAARAIVDAAPDRLPVFARINSLTAGQLAADVAIAMSFRPFGIILPDIANVIDIEELGAHLRVSEAELGLADGGTRILPTIGLPAGALAFTAGSQLPQRVAALVWEWPGSSFGERLNDAATLSRSLTVLAASRHNVPAIAALPLISDAGEAFKTACSAACFEGISGVIVRSEAQARVANTIF
ncbi:hypothetical protein [Pseudochelatococcus contaminans]|uniref:Citrate lyase subunit beta/citryl-CoA lyase n=1 Tax=Pseudochelatococcus contaminans TaxID=1538103 RepID=A0A7W5Z3E3_9HYPH|nr:hypothetical protein [Pseudochelatococcus contaminans]MBB3809352.1 citrate lyase subunit beta/citryl-CoA lyase [Pseudochelatococcus contaminans]